MLQLIAVVQDDGLTLGDIVRNIPHDAAAIIIYVLVFAFCAFIWHGSRHRGAS